MRDAKDEPYRQDHTAMVSAATQPAAQKGATLREMLLRAEQTEGTTPREAELRGQGQSETRHPAAAPRSTPLVIHRSDSSATDDARSPVAPLNAAERVRLEVAHIAHNWTPAVITTLGLLGAGLLAVVMLGLPVLDRPAGAPGRATTLPAFSADAGATYEPKQAGTAAGVDRFAAARARAEAMLARLPEQTPPPAGPRTPRLRLASLLIPQNSTAAPLPLRIELNEDGAFNGFVVLRGVPDEVRLSRGLHLRRGVWMLMPAELEGVRVEVASRAVPSFQLEAELINDQGVLLSRREAKVEIRADGD